MLLQEVLTKTTQFFKEKKLDSPRLDAELLLSAMLKIKRIDLYLKFDQPVSEDELIKCREAVRRRSAGEPVAYILGFKDFMDYRFFVDQRVLVPRPETELLAESAISWMKKQNTSNLDILDMGCGSGCLGLSIYKKIEESSDEKKVKVSLLDISEDALKVSRINSENLNCSVSCNFILQDAGEINAKESFDLIVANPPYIAHDDLRVQESVKKFEPHLALFANNNGFESIERWSQSAFVALKNGGYIGFEVGDGQAQRLFDLWNSMGFDQINIIHDLSGIARHVTAVKKALL